MINIPDDVAISFFKSEVGGVSTGSVHQARCPVCGDSEHNTSKRRMYLLKRGTDWTVFCHNCSYGARLDRFVKDCYPNQHQYFTSQCVNEFLFRDDTKELKKQKDKNELKSILNQGLNRINKKNGTKHPAHRYIEEHGVPLSDEHVEML